MLNILLDIYKNNLIKFEIFASWLSQEFRSGGIHTQLNTQGNAQIGFKLDYNIIEMLSLKIHKICNTINKRKNVFKTKRKLKKKNQRHQLLKNGLLGYVISLFD